MIGGGRGDWFDLVLALIAAGIAFPSQLLSLLRIEYWKQTKEMVFVVRVAAFIAYFTFATIIHFSLDEDYVRRMIPIVMIILMTMAYSFVSKLFGYDDDSPY